MDQMFKIAMVGHRCTVLSNICAGINTVDLRVLERAAMCFLEFETCCFIKQQWDMLSLMMFASISTKEDTSTHESNHFLIGVSVISVL